MKIEKLNLALSYPVQWGPYSVLRDFIQNFYDSIGPENFEKNFEYSYDPHEELLSMRTGKGFSRDWMMYIGTSSKRDSKAKTVGKFGEGFKVASLCAYRDLHWDIKTASRDWRVHVTEAADEIDGQNVQVLAYEVEHREFKEEAVLTLKGVKEDYEKAFRWVMEDFWYPGNPTLGELLFFGDGYAVYKPGTGSRHSVGALYAGYLRRASLDVPVIVCYHVYAREDEDREREAYGEYEVEKCLENLIKRLSPAEARIFLEAIRCKWHGRKVRHDLGYNWPAIVRELIDCVTEDEVQVERFKATHGEEIIADFDRADFGNRRARVLTWWRNSEYHSRPIVMGDFYKLKIPTLLASCISCGGFENLKEPEGTERRRVEILRHAALDIFGALLCYPDGLPPVRVIANRPPLEGSARCRPTEGLTQKNRIGVSVKYEIREVRLRAELLQRGMFPEALVTCMHELLHQYGGDSSRDFRRMLALMASRMYIAGDQLVLYESAWDAADTTSCAGEADAACQEGGR